MESSRAEWCPEVLVLRRFLTVSRGELKASRGALRRTTARPPPRPLDRELVVPALPSFPLWLLVGFCILNFQ